MRFFRSLLTIPHIAIVTAFGTMMGLFMRMRDPTGDWVLDLARWWSGWVTRFAGVRINVDNRANLDPQQPYVFMANHASALDIWALFLAIPRRVRMIAKKQLARIPFLGWVMWAGRFIFIDRANAVAARRSIDDAGRRIRGGTSVLIFPEGTRTRDGQLGTFKKGGFHLAMEAGVPIVPVALRGTRALMPRGSLRLRSGEVFVTIGAPIPTSGIAIDDRPALIQRVRDAIVAMAAETGG
ncbi:MAG: lysophospholipid acyltransferase family protein [Polyangia bacterium]